MRHGIMIIGALLVLGGCGGISLKTAEPSRILTLNTSSVSKTHSKSHPMNHGILVERPVLAVGLNTTGVSYRNSPYELSYYENLVWPDDLETTLHHFIGELLDKHGKYQEVGLSRRDVKPDFFLQTTVSHFEIRYDSGNPTIHVALTFKLLDSKDRRVLKVHPWKTEVPLKGDRLEDIGAGFSIAINQWAQEISKL